MDIFREGFYIPEGSFGVIVSVLSQDEAYIVEFNNIKNNPVITMYHNEIAIIKPE
jgi:alcohol dehydrogenase YqhD (iron-dependent ADH family)